MVTASIPFRPAIRSAHRRTPLGERVSRAGAAVLSVAGMVGVITLVALALLVVPIAAALAFGPTLLDAL